MSENLNNEEIKEYINGLEITIANYIRKNSDLLLEVERLTEDNRQLKKAFEISEGIIKRMGNAAENAAKEGKPSV